MAVRYTNSRGGTCGAEAQRRVTMLADLHDKAVTKSFAIPTILQQLLPAANDTPTLVTTQVTDATTLVTTTVPIQTEVYVDVGERIEVSIDFAIPYQTVSDSSAAPVPTLYEAGPFILRHEVYSNDSVTGNEIIESISDELLLPSSYLATTVAGVYVTTAAGLFMVQGSKHITSQESTARNHRFSLMWILDSSVVPVADWNTLNVLGGWSIEAYVDGAIPFPTVDPPVAPFGVTVAVARPNITTFNIRYFPAPVSTAIPAQPFDLSDLAALPWTY
jgi:hypothetical protein